MMQKYCFKLMTGVLQVIAFSLISGIRTTFAADWPCCRGPNQDGCTAETIASWPPKEVWRANIGQGFSQVVVSNGRVYTMGWSNGLDQVYCFSESSTGINPPVLWQASYPARGHGADGDYGTRATPTVDGGNQVYTFSCDGLLNCYDAATGNTNWSMMVNVGGDPGWGFCGSPLVEGSNVIVNAGDSGVAIDKSGSRTNWTSSGVAGYGAPYAVTVGTQRTVVVFSQSGCSGVDPASGTLLWWYYSAGSFDPGAIAPIIYSNKLWSAQSYGPATVVNIGSGNLLMDNEPGEWQTNLLCGDSGGILYNGYIYQSSYPAQIYVPGTGMVYSGGIKCVEFATGITQWTSPGYEFDDWSSVMRAGDQLVLMTGSDEGASNGNLVVAQATPAGYQEVYRANGILPGETWTCPTLSNGRLYVRNNTTTPNTPATLICYNVSAATNNIPPAAWIQNYYFGTASNNYASLAASVASNGMTVWQNYLAGTNPTNSSSSLQVGIVFSNSSIAVTYPTLSVVTGLGYTATARCYGLESSSNLLSGTWQAVVGATNVLGNNTAAVYTNASPNASMFYRVRATLQ